MHPVVKGKAYDQYKFYLKPPDMILPKANCFINYQSLCNWIKGSEEEEKLFELQHT